MKNINTTGYVILSSGAWDTYASGVFKVLKPFSFLETAEVFAKENPEEERLEAYILWLSDNGYVCHTYDIKEVHVGTERFYDEKYFKSVYRTVFLPKGE